MTAPFNYPTGERVEIDPAGLGHVEPDHVEPEPDQGEPEPEPTYAEVRALDGSIVTVRTY